MTDTAISHSRAAAREQSGSSATRAALAEALEAERLRLADAERDPAAEARSTIAGLEAQLERQTTLDAERAAEQEALVEPWRVVQAELVAVVGRMAEIGAEMAGLDARDEQLTNLRAAAADNPATARYELRRLQCGAKHLIQPAALESLARQASGLQLASDRDLEPSSRIVYSPPPPPPPHFPAGGESTGRCLADGEYWPCATAQAARASRESALTRRAER